MTLKFEAKIIVDAKEKTKAIFNSLNTDNKYYPENPTKTTMSFDGTISIDVKSDQIPHMRANLNSTLRLIEASYAAIEAIKI